MKFVAPYALALSVVLILLSCSSAEKASSIGANQYADTISNYTGGSRKYKGFYNTFEAHITMLNSIVQSAQLQRKTEYYQWNSEQQQRERDKAFQDMSSGASFFLSFYSPESEYNDLNKPNTIWKVYLESNGQRYEGKIKKLTDKESDLQTLYPHFNRFSTAYLVTFSLPMSTVEKSEAKITLTSSLGSDSYSFKP